MPGRNCVLNVIACFCKGRVAFNFVYYIFPLRVHLIKMINAGFFAFQVAQYLAEDKDLISIVNTVVFEQ